MTSPFIWQGRNDPEDGDLAKRWHHQVTKSATTDTIAGLIGFACDEGVLRNKGRMGAKDGPDAIRSALANMAWHHKGTICDYGDICADGHDLESAQDILAQSVKKTLSQHQKAIVLGGGHETAFGSFKGLFDHVQDQAKKKIAILNLDAHFDLRRPGENGASSGTPFYQIQDHLHNNQQDLHYLCLGVAEQSNTQALFQRANDWGVAYLLDEEMGMENLDKILSKIDQFLDQCDYLYFTIDLDVLPFWQMPGVSAPASLGVDIRVIETIIKHVGRHPIKWPLSDLVEYSPPLDPQEFGAKTAARLCDQILKAMIR